MNEGDKIKNLGLGRLLADPNVYVKTSPKLVINITGRPVK